MLEKNTKINVTNREKGTVGYRIPDLGNLNRQFQPNETKEIEFEELEKLSWLPGGDYILRNCLIIDNEDAIKELLGSVEPEYFYTKDQVVELMKNGSLDEFLDCLDFAPQGVCEMIKDLAVSMPLNDVAKRNAIAEKLGFNVDNAIALTSDVEEKEKKTERRAAVAAPERRTVKIIKK